MELTTVEGLAPAGQLHPIQRAFQQHHGLQCGYCTPATVLSTCARRLAVRGSRAQRATLVRARIS
ncbi:MAG TPA: 2Fe-2S iron-sulfur cluster-binding protein [Candidatus Binatia bacterium]|nr:2Fe-2S iron-sulfur cluster-binding protein [Candidatus Binatia bacterium]